MLINIGWIIGILLSLGIVIGSIKLCEMKYELNPEMSRKAVHVAMGCITLTLPWIFNDNWPVMLLGILALGVMVTIRASRSFKQNIGSVLHGVNRSSYGEIYFPLSIAILFYFANGDRILYCIPVLILTFADSAAALIGSSYGRNHLSHQREDLKSVEGSFAFFIVAFLSTHIPILLFTDIGKLESLLLSVIIGLLVALIEIISYRGSDNLMVPLLSYTFLKIHMGLSAQSLTKSLLIILIISTVIFVINKRATLTKLGVIGSIVYGYLIIILGGLHWFLPPFMHFVTYPVFPLLKEEEKKQIITYHIVESNIIVGLTLLWLASVTDMKHVFFFGYTISFALHSSMHAYIRLHSMHKVKKSKAILFAMLKSAGFIVFPGVLINHFYAYQSIGRSEIIISMVLILTGILIVDKLKQYFDYESISEECGRANAFTVCILTSLLILTQYMIGG